MGENVKQHPDDAAVDRFAAAMKDKLAEKRRQGYGGWDRPSECRLEFLSRKLRQHVAKGDPVDVANFAMMLHQRGSMITPPDGVIEFDTADLIADLLEALKDLASESKETFAHWPDLKKQTESAIAKAEGRP
jgi:hypothetical protein